MTAVTGLLAALHRRTMTGEGSYMRVALADVALAAVASMGWLAEAEERGSDRPRQGNYLYGSFGVDFTTSDQRHVMVVALTTHQWRALCTATGTAEASARWRLPCQRISPTRQTVTSIARSSLPYCGHGSRPEL